MPDTVCSKIVESQLPEPNLPMPFLSDSLQFCEIAALFHSPTRQRKNAAISKLTCFSQKRTRSYNCLRSNCTHEYKSAALFLVSKVRPALANMNLKCKFPVNGPFVPSWYGWESRSRWFVHCILDMYLVKTCYCIGKKIVPCSRLIKCSSVQKCFAAVANSSAVYKKPTNISTYLYPRVVWKIVWPSFK